MPTKTRSFTSQAGTAHYVGTYLPTGQVTVFDWTSAPFVARSEIISDSSAKRRVRRRSGSAAPFEVPNDCDHTVRTRTPLPANVDYIVSSTRHVTTNVAALHDFQAPLAFEYSGRMSADLAVDWGSLSAEAWQTLYPSMRSDGPSLVNFVLELKDIKNLSSLARLGFLRDLNKRYKARKTAEYLANAHLSYSFAIAPFFRDVVSIFNALNSFKERWESMIRGMGKVHRAHWRKTLTDTSLLPSKAIKTVSGSDQYWWEYEWASQPLYTATAYYRYTILDTSFLGYVAGLLDTLGVQLNPAIWWEAVPFSFVVDWFLGVGNWLDQFHINNLPVEVQLIDFCHSIKFGQRAQLSRNFGGGSYPRVQLWAETVQSYRRRRAIPRMFKSVSAGSGFGPQQGALAGSLLISHNRLRY